MVDYSIVCTVFNDGNKLERFIGNIMCQSVCPKEIVVVDGGSTDNSIEILNSLEKSVPIELKVIRNGRMSISQGLNEGIKKAKSQYVGIVAVGNRYGDRFFEELLESIEDGNDIVFSPIRGEEYTSFQKLYNNTFLRLTDGEPLKMASNHGLVIRKKVFDKVGFFCEGLYYAGEDAEYYERAASMGVKMECNDKALLFWDTPRNFVEFNKQTKLYCIADIQLRAYNRTVKDLLIVLLSLVVGYMLAFAFLRWYFVFLGPLLLYCVCIYKKKGKLDMATLLFLKILLRSFYVGRYIYFFSPRYGVERNI